MHIYFLQLRQKISNIINGGTRIHNEIEKPCEAWKKDFDEFFPDLNIRCIAWKFVWYV